jgi:hypothetical protein
LVLVFTRRLATWRRRVFFTAGEFKRERPVLSLKRFCCAWVRTGVMTGDKDRQYGEVQTVTTSVSGAVLYTQGLQYDAVGNPLVSEETLSGAARQESYQHDAVGRLTSVARNGVTTTYAYGPNSTRVRAGADVATFDAQDRLLSQGATTYTWDVHGNRATDSTGVTYTHDGLGRLTGWRKGTTSLAYEVDALERRVLRRRNGVVTARYVYEGQYRVVAELESQSRFLYATHGHSPDAMVRGGVTYVYVKNHLGSDCASSPRRARRQRFAGRPSSPSRRSSLRRQRMSTDPRLAEQRLVAQLARTPTRDTLITLLRLARARRVRNRELFENQMATIIQLLILGNAELSTARRLAERRFRKAPSRQTCELLAAAERALGNHQRADALVARAQRLPEP